MFESAASLLKVSTVVLCAGLLAACGPNIPETVKIGVAQPLSGPAAARGQDILNGATLAAAELNAAGFKIGGKPVRIEIVAMDDKANKDEAMKVAQAMVDQKVTAVIGHLSSDVTEATIPIYKSGDVPQLFTSSAESLTRLGEGNAFRLVANDALQARAIAGYLVDTRKVGKVAFIYEDTAYGAPMAKDASASFTKRNTTVVLSVGVDKTLTDFAEFVDKLKAAAPDALVAVVRDHQLLPLFAQMKAAGLSELPVLVTSTGKTQKVVSGPADVKTVFLTSSALSPSEFSAGTAFLAKFRAAYKSEPVWAAHYAYDAVQVLADVMRRADSVEASALRKKLAAVDAIAPVTNTMRFGTDGEQRYGAISVYQKRAQQWEPLMRSDLW